ATHHFDNEHAAVRLGGGVQPVDRFRGNIDGRIKAECLVGAGDIVVDGLRHANDGDAAFVNSRRDTERVVATDGNQHIDAEPLQIVGDGADLFVGGIG